ncbi:MAG: S24/S26 family peptidase [Clostridia bacterium]|nr:S24/S26 family peptidase [Clostridia bacterium]
MSPDGQKKKEIIERQGAYLSTPQGRSMLPMLRGMKDTIAVVALSGRAKKRDILLYENPQGTHVLHRVIRVTKEGYYMRGDNCYMVEPLLLDEQVIGKLDQFWRGEKCHRADGIWWRFYGVLVCLSFPLRYVCHAVLCKIKKWLRTNGKDAPL